MVVSECHRQCGHWWHWVAPLPRSLMQIQNHAIDHEHMSILGQTDGFRWNISSFFSLSGWLKSLRQGYLWKTRRVRGQWLSGVASWRANQFYSFFNGHWTFSKSFYLGNQNWSCLKLNLLGEKKTNHSQVRVLSWSRNLVRDPCNIWLSAERTQESKLSRNTKSFCAGELGMWSTVILYFMQVSFQGYLLNSGYTLSLASLYSGNTNLWDATQFGK